MLGTLGALALPVVLGRAVDSIVTGGSPVWFWLAAGLVLLGIAVDLVDAYAGTACVAGTTAWLRDRFVRHVLSAGPRHGFETGDLVSRVSGNAAEAANAGPAVVTVWMAVLPPVGSLVLLAYLDIWLAVAFLAGRRARRGGAAAVHPADRGVGDRVPVGAGPASRRGCPSR